MKNTKETDVIIVGGGPVGLAMSIELAAFHIRTVVIERWPTIQQLPKAQGLNARTMEFMRRWGISEEIKRTRLLPKNITCPRIECHGFHSFWNKKQTQTKQIETDSSPESPQRIPLWCTQHILQEKAQSLFVQLALGWTVFSIDQSDFDINVFAKRTDDSGGELNIKAKFLIGCDGANSCIRNALNIVWEYYEFLGDTLNIIFKTQELDKLINFEEKAMLYYINNNSQQGAFGRIDSEGLWYAQIQLENKDPTNHDEIKQSLYTLSGVKFECEIKSSNAWINQQGIANRFRNGRTFLAGDAAHIMSPTGGHGLNTGFGDVVNLAWKIAAVIQGWGRESLLDTYEQERKPVAINNMQRSNQNAKNLMVFTQPSTSTLIPSNTGGIDDKIMPHLWISPGKALYDLLDNRFNIIAFDNNFELSTCNEIPQQIPINIIKLPENIKPENFSKYYLLRPDLHINWQGDERPEGSSLRLDV